MGSNPFFHRGPVRDPDFFFGRGPELTSLFGLLVRGQSVSISGQRRLGKTSLLFHAATPEVAAKHGLDPVHARWVYIEGGMLDGLGEEWLYGAIWQGLGGDVESVPYPRLVEKVRELATRGLRLIVALDEFEVLAHNALLQPRVFNRLRGLTGQFPVQFVIASKAPLARLSFANPAVLSSSFFGFFAPFVLPLFRAEEAAELLRKLSKRAGSAFDTDTADYVLGLVGPHPLFLQVAGYYAFDEQRKGALSPQARTAVRERALAELRGHLEYYWRGLSSEEQYALATLPLAAPDGYWPALDGLTEAGLLYENDYLGSMWREFVSQQQVDGLLRHRILVMDERRRLLSVDGKPVHLTPTELAALRLLMRNQGRLVTPEEIEASLWPDDLAPDPERARQIVKKLRRVLGQAGEAIVTQRGQGFMLV